MTWETKDFWLARRDDEPCYVFDTRQEAIKWLKEILIQTLKDFSHQDRKETQFTYEVDFPRIRLTHHEERPSELGL